MYKIRTLVIHLQHSGAPDTSCKQRGNYLEFDPTLPLSLYSVSFCRKKSILLCPKEITCYPISTDLTISGDQTPYRAGPGMLSQQRSRACAVQSDGPIIRSRRRSPCN
uniref:Uncharacterized protein n=1 Tax=Scleropages formosus TaxID=113540 RepID=A0A8C9QTP7_SCLFO